MRNRRLFIGLTALGIVAALGTLRYLSDPAPPGSLTDLDAVAFANLKESFNESAGSVRLIVLLSPT
jgi:hypothetical protein